VPIFMRLRRDLRIPSDRFSRSPMCASFVSAAWCDRSRGTVLRNHFWREQSISKSSQTHCCDAAMTSFTPTSAPGKTREGASPVGSSGGAEPIRLQVDVHRPYSMALQLTGYKYR